MELSTIQVAQAVDARKQESAFEGKPNIHLRFLDRSGKDLELVLPYREAQKVLSYLFHQLEPK